MNKKKKNNYLKKVLIVIALIIFISFNFFYFLSDDRKNNIIFNLSKDLSASISKVISMPYTKNQNNNNDLIKEINKDYEKEIDDLKKTLNLNNAVSDKKLINASVIKRSTNFWYNILTIDKGKKDNIKKGNAVINSSGLIGKVIKVNNNSSDIKLITSKNNSGYISAVFYLDNIPYYGLIDEYNIKNNELYLKNVIGNFDINKIKDINVTTSGFSDSFSSGLLIGKIKNIKKETYGISNKIIITPAANFNDLKIVTVAGEKNEN